VNITEIANLLAYTRRVTNLLEMGALMVPSNVVDAFYEVREESRNWRDWAFNEMQRTEGKE
jgi:hypothetical protein